MPRPLACILRDRIDADGLAPTRSTLDHFALAGWTEVVREQGEMMQVIYGGFGGLVRTDTLESLLRCKTDQPISVIAKWIVRRTAVHLQWNAQTLFPMFQFDLERMTIRPEVAVAIGELSCVFDDWEVAHWFASANAWLSGRRPLEVVFADARAVRNAARADRFIANG